MLIWKKIDKHKTSCLFTIKMTSILRLPIEWREEEEDEAKECLVTKMNYLRTNTRVEGVAIPLTWWLWHMNRWLKEWNKVYLTSE